MTEPVRRLSGPKVVIGFGALVVAIAATAIGLWYLGREPTGRIRAIAPVDDTRALVLREGFRQHEFVHLTLRDIERGQLWSVPFNDVPRDAVPVATRTRAAIWVLNHRRRLEIHAFDLETGRFAFRAAETVVPVGVEPRVDMAAVRDTIVASLHVGGDTRVLVIDSRTGRVLGNHGVDDQPDAPTLLPRVEDVIVRTRDGIARIADPSDGSVSVAPPGFGNAEAPQLTDIPFAIVAKVSGREVPVRAPVLRGEVYWVASGTSIATIDANSGRVLAHTGPVEWSSTRRTRGR